MIPTFTRTGVSARWHVPYAVEENLRGMTERKNERKKERKKERKTKSRAFYYQIYYQSTVLFLNVPTNKTLVNKQLVDVQYCRKNSRKHSPFPPYTHE